MRCVAKVINTRAFQGCQRTILPIGSLLSFSCFCIGTRDPGELHAEFAVSLLFLTVLVVVDLDIHSHRRLCVTHRWPCRNLAADQMTVHAIPERTTNCYNGCSMRRAASLRGQRQRVLSTRDPEMEDWVG